MKKIYPNAVVLRKTMVVVSSILVVCIVILIVSNIYHATHLQEDRMANLASKKNSHLIASNTDWYRDMSVQKINAVAKPATVKIFTGNGQEVNNNVIQAADMTDDMKKAMHAQINSNQLSGEQSQTSKFEMFNKMLPMQSSSNLLGGLQQTGAIDQNMQAAKKTFLKVNNESVEDDYLHEKLNNPKSIYELKAGWIVPAILVTGINSDLPGQTIAQVRSNVRDTVSGRNVLIPQGSKLIGVYDSQVTYGQSRVLIVWKRIIYPNGQSINLEGMPGVDMSGYAGMHDKVDNHYFKLFGSVLLMSIVSSGAQLSIPRNEQTTNVNTGPTVRQTLAESLGTNIMNVSNHLIEKNLGVQPTLVIRPGYLFNVEVTKDIVFPSAYSD